MKKRRKTLLWIARRKRDITDWIGRPHEPPSRNKDEEAEGEKYDVGATQALTEENSPINEYKEGCDSD